MESGMADTAILSEKGWVVIPKKMRQRHGLKKGDRVHVVDDGGVISIIPVSRNPIDEAYGSLKGKTSLLDALLKSRKEDAARGK